MFNQCLISKPNTAVHVTSLEQLKMFFKWANDLGYMWADNTHYSKETAEGAWFDTNFETCICLAKGVYDALGIFETEGYTIISYEEAQRFDNEKEN